MGQCMPTTLHGHQQHPTLGPLRLATHNKQSYLSLSLVIGGQEDYLEWSKKINKLKFSRQLQQTLYLPFKQQYNKGNGLCRGGSCLQLLLEPYRCHIEEAIQQNIQKGDYVAFGLLWEVLTAVVKYAKYQEEKEEKSTGIRFEHVLLFQREKVRIIPKELTQGCVLPMDQLEIVQQLDDPIRQSKQSSGNNIYAAGLLILSLACNIPPHTVYSTKQHSWLWLPTDKLQTYLKQCCERYNSEVSQIIRAMLGSKQFRQPTLMASLARKIQNAQYELNTKRQNQSVVGMGQSMIAGQVKNSHFNESKPLQEQEAMLKISNINMNQLQKASTDDFPLDQELSIPSKQILQIDLL